MRRAGVALLGRTLGNRAVTALVGRSAGGTLQRETEPADIAAQSAFNPMDIRNKLLNAIDQADTYMAGGTVIAPIMQRKVKFSAVVRLLTNLSAREAQRVGLEYSKHEGRTLEWDLFGEGESGYQSNLKEGERAQIRALLAGTRSDDAAPTDERQAATVNLADAQAAEVHRLLHGDLGSADVERVMTILRQGVGADAALAAAYQRLAGIALAGDIVRMGPGNMVRALWLLGGNTVAADAAKVTALKSQIAGIDKQIADLEETSLGRVAGLFSGGVNVQGYQIAELRKGRKKLVEEIEQRGEQVAAEAHVRGEDAQARVGAVLGDTKALGEKVQGVDAAVLAAIAKDDPGAKAAAQLRKLAESGDLNAAKLAAALRGLRAEAEQRARRMLPPGDPGLAAKAQALADEYFAKLRTAYNDLVPAGGEHFDEIVNETGGEDEENLNKRLWVEAGKLDDVEELVRALRGDRKDTETVERVLRNKNATEIAVLKVKYTVTTGGRSLDLDLFGVSATKAGEDDISALSTVSAEYRGKAAGTTRLNLEDFLQRPDKEGGPAEVKYILARAEREYEYTIEHGGITGSLNDAWGNEPRALLDETIVQVRNLYGQYQVMVGWVPVSDVILKPANVGSDAARAIVQEMRLARHVIRGDRAAYEEATAALRATFEAIASFVLQAALTAVLTPAAAALFRVAKGAEAALLLNRVRQFAATVTAGTAATIGTTVVVTGDYSLAQLKNDLLSGMAGPLGAGGVNKLLASEMLGPVARGLVDRLGPKASAELREFAKNFGSMEASAAATGESLTDNLSLQNLLWEQLKAKGGEHITAGTTRVLGLDAPAPVPQTGKEGAGGEATTAPVPEQASAQPPAGTTEPMSGAAHVPLAEGAPAGPPAMLPKQFPAAGTESPAAAAVPSAPESATPAVPAGGAPPIPEEIGGGQGRPAGSPPGPGGQPGDLKPIRDITDPIPIRDLGEAEQALRANLEANTPVTVLNSHQEVEAAWNRHPLFKNTARPPAWVDMSSGTSHLVVDGTRVRPQGGPQDVTPLGTGGAPAAPEPTPGAVPAADPAGAGKSALAAAHAGAGDQPFAGLRSDEIGPFESLGPLDSGAAPGMSGTAELVRPLDRESQLSASGFKGSLAEDRKGFGAFPGRVMTEQGNVVDAVVKIIPPGKRGREIFDREVAGAKAAAATGTGPAFYGVLPVENGLAFAMEPVRGGFPDSPGTLPKGSPERQTAEREAQAARLSVTAQAAQDARNYGDALLHQGYGYYKGEIQGLIGPDGRWRPIDFAGIDPLPAGPAERAAALARHHETVEQQAKHLEELYAKKPRWAPEEEARSAMGELESQLDELFNDEAPTAIAEPVERVDLTRYEESQRQMRQHLEAMEADPQRAVKQAIPEGQAFTPETLRDLMGMSDVNQQGIQSIVDGNNPTGKALHILMRPTIKRAPALMEQGAEPKPMDVKAKTANAADKALGLDAPAGTVAYGLPRMPERPPGMRDNDWGRLQDRYFQRLAEHGDQAHKMTELQKPREMQQGTTGETQLEVLPGGQVVTPEGNPFTGDHDMMEMTYADGSPIAPQDREAIVAALGASAVRHGALGDWAPKGPAEIAIANVIKLGHWGANPEAEPLILFAPNQSPQASYYAGKR
jgi:hypothetical protein